MVRSTQSKENIWLDVTDLLVWRGNFTGIQRVIYEYALRFSREGAHLFAYDNVDNRLFELTLDDLNFDIEFKRGGVVRPLRLRRKIRHIIGKPYYKLSDEKRAFLAPYVHAANHTVRSTLHALKRHDNEEKDHSPYEDFAPASFQQYDTAVLIGASWNEPGALRLLSEQKQYSNIRIVQHINDLLPIYQPQLFAEELILSFSKYMELTVLHVDIFTVISDATRRDLVAYFKQNTIKKPRVEVVRLGDNPAGNETAKKPKELVADKYILAVGTFEVRKNYILLYQAAKLAQIEKKEIPQIVIAGRQGWLSSDLQHLIKHDPYTHESILWLENMTDGEIKWLYEHCLFTVFPSIAEGWGLPIAESLQHGKFCLTSGTSSMLEIGKGLVDYFLPYDARELVEKIHYYMAEERYRFMNEKAKSDYKVFTWNESYEQYLNALQSK